MEKAREAHERAGLAPRLDCLYSRTCGWLVLHSVWEIISIQESMMIKLSERHVQGRQVSRRSASPLSVRASK